MSLKWTPWVSPLSRVVQSCWLNFLENGRFIQEELKEMSGLTTVPNVFIDGQHVGGADDTFAARESGRLADLLRDSRM